jgi:hypothetical protein
MLYVLYAGFKGQSDRRAAIAAGVVAAIHVPLIFLAAFLHGRNITMRSVRSADQARPERREHGWALTPRKLIGG